jgi:putative spermidine/putrescine transport system substrate-binding protein
MHKKLIVIFTLIGLLVLASIPATSQDKETLIVSTFGFNLDVIEQNIKIPFEEMYDVEIIYDTGNNSDRLAQLAELGENSEVDVIHLAGIFPHRAKALELFQAIDPELLESYDELYEWAQDPLGDSMGVAYAINSHALAYRSDLIEDPITSWNDLLREDLTGFVSVPDMSTTFGPATIIMMGYAAGGDPEDFEDYTEKGWEQMPALVDQIVTGYIRSSELVALYQEEEVWASPYSSFARGNLINTELPIEFVIPEEGAVGDPITVSITAASDNVELAHKYIDFIISHDVQLQEATDLIDSPTNMTVEVPEEQAALLTYGDELLGSLVFMDQTALVDVIDEWLERWNEIMLQ